MEAFFLSGHHIKRILGVSNGDFRISLDLGISKSDIHVSDTKMTLPDGQDVGIDTLAKLHRRRSLNDCFMVADNDIKWIYAFEDNSAYKLYEPKMDWPTTLSINGSFMHTVATSTPMQEAQAKAKSLGRIHGEVLDTVFGLGYTSKLLIDSGAKSVSSYEISDAVLEIARVNPWSRDAFNDMIHVEKGDVYSAIKAVSNSSFDFVLHDPPTLQSRSGLYSESFYMELYRVLRPGGRMYHFIGTKTQTPKHNYRRGIIARLRKCGFTIKDSYRGILAEKLSD